MQRLLLLGILVGGVASAAPRGRVVRVEQVRGSTKAPLVCGFQRDLEGLCVGVRPAVGDVVTIIDAKAVVAEVEITRVEQRACETVFTVHGSLRTGALVLHGRSMGVGDAGGDSRRYRTMDAEGVAPPTSNPEEKVVLAYDRDDDSKPDLLITRYTCDARGVPSTLNAVDRCLDIYTRTRAGLVRHSQTKQMSCL